MKATAVIKFNLDPLVEETSKIEFDLRLALCLLAHPDCEVQVESAPIKRVEIEDLWVEKGDQT